tara:strand:- start:89 stop:943 length:855 start_codon:yes stop_codon:yes gene_type:complete
MHNLLLKDKKMLKKIFLIILVFSKFSCSKENSSTPAYVEINNVNLLTDPNFGESTENITDIWFYVDDILQGVYEIPVQFPILEKGTKNIRIRAGVKANGISSTRIQYPFYSSYTDTIELNEDESISISPEFTYNNTYQAIIEDFESSGTIIDSTLNSEIDFSIISEDQENYYAYAKIDTPNINFEVSTQDLILPQQGAPVYLEIDYKCSTEFLVGVYVNYSQNVEKKELIWVTSKEDWNKIYINLTQTISESIGAESFKVFLNMRRMGSSYSEEISFDNVKILY